MTPNRLEVHAAIEQLISEEGDWRDPARIIARYGSTLKTTGAFEISLPKSKKNSSDNQITGFVPGVGEVSVKDENKEKSAEGRSRGYLIPRECVGHYRLWRPRKRQIQFRHYWASEIDSRGQGSGSTEYLLRFDIDSLEPTYFGILHKVTLLDLFDLELATDRLEVRRGPVPHWFSWWLGL